jgi:hypothetical protein
MEGHAKVGERERGVAAKQNYEAGTGIKRPNPRNKENDAWHGLESGVKQNRMDIYVCIYVFIYLQHL